MFIVSLVTVFLFAALLQGCATPFAKHYHDQTGGIDLSKLPHVILPTGEPQVHRGGNPENDGLRMLEDNYGLIGYSSFNAGNVNENGAITQAKKVNASVIILY